MTPFSDLPIALNLFEATEAAYPHELAQCHQALSRSLPMLVECDKALVPFFYKCLRDRLKADGLRTIYLDGRPQDGDPPGLSLMGRIAWHLANHVRGAVQERIIVLPHLDLMMSTMAGSLSGEAREIVALLYENPEVVWLGFKDLSLPLPTVIEGLFPRQVGMLGIQRERLDTLVTQSEARKLGTDGLDVYRLYKYVSGVNAVTLRRVLAAVDGEDLPIESTPAWDQIRSATLHGNAQVPDIDLFKDIGGYDDVKKRIKSEIIDLVDAHHKATDPAAVERIEKLIPKGLIFWGPPGTGKTLFAKAMANALGAAVIIVSGPELKSKWVGESEANLRRVFVQARQSAPCVIVFDELDSFASARGTYDGAGVQHSMVNQLLTEMDGFRNNEMVFVVGTTNFPDILDGALLRPGRFEFQLPIPFPNPDDRRAILAIYDQQLDLKLSEQAMTYAVERTGEPVEGTESLYTGDHLYALCRALSRQRLREDNTGPSEVADVEQALSANVQRVRLTKEEQALVAVHEAGHALCALYCEHVPPIQRISIRGDLGGALGFVRLADRTNRHVLTKAELVDALCMLFGGHQAETLIYGDVSVGAGMDLERATGLARDILEVHGMGVLAPASYRVGELSNETKKRLDDAVIALLEEARDRAHALLKEHRAELLILRDQLLAEQVLDSTSLPRAFQEKGNG